MRKRDTVFWSTETNSPQIHGNQHMNTLLVYFHIQTESKDLLELYTEKKLHLVAMNTIHNHLPIPES